MAVFQYIEGWYNTHRRHSSIDYYAPIAFERRYTSSIQHVEPLTVHQIGGNSSPIFAGCQHPTRYTMTRGSVSSPGAVHVWRPFCVSARRRVHVCKPFLTPITWL